MRSLLDECTDALAIHRDEKILYANPAGLKLFGYERLEQVLGRSVYEFVSPSYRPIVARRIFETYATRVASPELEERLLHASGQELPVEVLALPVPFEGQVATLVHIRDISARKELERKLAAADQLASVGFIARAVVHEVDGPLAYAINNVGLLERYLEATLPGERAEEARRLSGRIRAGLQGVRAAMRDVRVFAEAASEEPSELDLHALLDSVANLVAFHVRGHARLLKRYGDVPKVIGTRTRLGQLFASVLTYAAQVPLPEGVRENEVTISTRAETGKVVVRVHFAASGPHDEAETALVIARTLLEDEGGAIEVRDEPPGTTLVITLRAAASAPRPSRN